MAFFGQIVDIFVSSPGDVAKYRDLIIGIVQSWNQRNGRNKKLFFNCLRWEDLIAPDIGDYGQSVINEQVGDTYDIFLGVMWSKFGTPTANANSGTEEEFDRAVSRHNAGEQIKVSLLFCTADIPQAQLDGIQYSRVQEFKSKAQSNGCLTRDFFDEASLINSINLILDRFSNSWEYPKAVFPEIDGSGSVNEKSTSDHEITLLPESINKVVDPDDDGIFDVSERFALHNENLSSVLGQWSKRLDEIEKVLSTTTENLAQASALGKPDSSQIRSILKPMTDSMEAFAEWCEKEISNIEHIMHDLSSDTLKLTDLSRDLSEPNEDIQSVQIALSELVVNIDSANNGISSFADSLEESPKLDKKLNRANRRLVEVHRKLVEENRLMKENMILCIEDLSSRLN